MFPMLSVFCRMILNNVQNMHLWLLTNIIIIIKIVITIINFIKIVYIIIIIRAYYDNDTIISFIKLFALLIIIIIIINRCYFLYD